MPLCSKDKSHTFLSHDLGPISRKLVIESFHESVLCLEEKREEKRINARQEIEVNIAKGQKEKKIKFDGKRKKEGM